MKPTANRLTAALVAALSLGALALSYAGEGGAQQGTRMVCGSFEPLPE